MRWITLAACVGLAACSGGGATRSSLNQAPAQMVELTAEQRGDVETGVRRGLKDPNSAMFGSMKAAVDREKADTYVVCGWVNSKNSFGGYVGDQPFYAVYFPKNRVASLIGVGGPSIDTTVVLNQCANQGVKLLS